MKSRDKKVETISVKDWVDFIDGYNKDGRQILGFIFLWMKYNAWFNKKCEDRGNERQRAKSLSEDDKANQKYEENKNPILSDFKKIPSKHYSGDRYDVYNPKDDVQVIYSDEKSGFENYLEVIYQIRCNFFHGDKGRPDETNVALIKWAYNSFQKLLI